MLNKCRSQKLNVDRMRRHMARDTPDSITLRFDAVRMDYIELDIAVDRELQKFRNKMIIKHRGAVTVFSYSAPELDLHPGMATIRLIARPHKDKSVIPFNDSQHTHY